VLVRDIARDVARFPRRVTAQDGDAEAVTGVVLMRKARTREVLEALKARVDTLNSSAARAGVAIVPFYDRTLAHRHEPIRLHEPWRGRRWSTVVLLSFSAASAPRRSSRR